MVVEPLFVRFANGTAGLLDVCRSLAGSRDEKTARIASDVLSFPGLYISSVDDFRKEFRNCLESMVDNGLSNQVKDFLNSYTSAALVEYTSNSSYRNSGTSEQWLAVSNHDALWVEATICYNLMLFIKLGKLRDLKKCTKCGKYFSHKGSYAKFCSDACRGRSKE